MVLGKRGVFLTLEALFVLSLAPIFLLLVEASKGRVLWTIHRREDSLLAHDILQAWDESGQLQLFEKEGDAVLIDDIERLSADSKRRISLWSCKGECICEKRELKEMEVILCIGRE